MREVAVETRIFGGLRFKVHRTGRAIGRVDGPRQKMASRKRHQRKRVISRDQISVQLESLILAQSERWRQA